MSRDNSDFFCGSIYLKLFEQWIYIPTTQFWPLRMHSTFSPQFYLQSSSDSTQ